MREILFRGKRVGKGEWIYGSYVQQYGATMIYLPDGIDSEHGFDSYHVDPETVGKFTGLADKNGRKIFEGDILRCNNNPIDLVKAVYGEFGVIDVETETAVDNVIGWHYEVIPTDELSKVEPFCLPMPLTKYYIDRCKMVVIGNIHDNPGMLEVM